MECDPQFRIEINQTNNQIFFQETLTLSYKDNFDFEEELKANITNPFAVKLDSFQVNKRQYLFSFNYMYNDGVY